jgi:hypothetical protein
LDAAVFVSLSAMIDYSKQTIFLFDVEEEEIKLCLSHSAQCTNISPHYLASFAF